MKVTYHAAASVVLGAASAAAIGGTFAAGLVLFGVLLDVDHIEHYGSRGMPMNLGGFLGAVSKTQEKLERQHGFRRGVPASWGFPVLHSVELLLFASALALVSGKLFLYGVAAGVATHLLMDLRAYPMSPRFFSVLWRAHNWRGLRLAWRKWRT